MNLGKYEILEELGRGGFGIVYKAKDTVLNRLVAIKVLHPNLVNDPTFLVRFKQEAQIAAQLDHPNLVPVYDFGQEEGRYYIAMGYMPGGSLKELLKGEGAFSQDRALDVFNKISAGLQYAHEQGIIHRDLKPGNILFDNLGQPRVSDLGFAKVVSSSASASMSTSGGLIGTPAYMAPEIWRGKLATPQTDVYSMGCILYEILTGEVLFEGDTSAELMTMHLLDGPQFKAPLPDPIRQVLAHALEREPRDRYQDMQEFSQGLVSATRKEQPTPALDSAEDETVVINRDRKPVKEMWRPRRWMVLGVGLLLVAGLAWGIGRVWRAMDRPASSLPTQRSASATAPLSQSPTEFPTEQQAAAEPLVQSTVPPTGPAAMPTQPPTAQATPTTAETALPGTQVITAQNVKQLEQIKVFEEMGSNQSVLAFSRDSKNLVSGGSHYPQDQPIFFWSTETWDVVRELVIDYDYKFLTPDAEVIVACGHPSYGDVCHFIDSETGNRLSISGFSNVKARQIAFSTDSKLMVTDLGGRLEVWDYQENKILKTRLFNYLWDLALSQDNKWLALTSWDCALRLVDVNSLEISTVIQSGCAYEVSFSPDSVVLAAHASYSASYSNSTLIKIFSVSDGKQIMTLEGHKDRVSGFLFSPDGQILVSGDAGGSILIWRVSDGTLLHSLEGHTGEVDKLAFSPDGKFLASSDGTVRVWGIP